MRVKLFGIYNPTGKKGRIQQLYEDAINRWLAENEGIEIVEIRQSASGGSINPAHVLISVWYREKA